MGCPSRAHGSEAGMARCVPEHPAWEVTCWCSLKHASMGQGFSRRILAGWLDLKQTSPESFWSILHQGALASHLKPKQCGPGVFSDGSHQCDLGTKSGVVASANQTCPGVSCLVTILVGLLGPACNSGPDATGWLGPPDRTLVCASKVGDWGVDCERECRPCL